MFIEIAANKESFWNRSPVLGVGINDSWYKKTLVINGKNYHCPYYVAWANMLKRCYCPKYLNKKPTYKGCSVVDEWLTFSNFREWMKTKDWKNKHLDKDLLVIGNKIYSPDRCLFVDKEINALFTDREAKRGDFKIGVSLNKRSNKFQSRCMKYGKKVYLGSYKKESDAYFAYLQFKRSHVLDIALTRDDPLKSALLRFVDQLTLEINQFRVEYP